ncbi:methionine synthase [Rhodococcus sp. NPDC058521]|uniref:methionine synthase n=1 Tax=Rhodococcus sp. NPDC058521 TaxID=3346536 RepID=UPI003646DDCB
MTQNLPADIAGKVTSVGSWPGVDARESARVILGELRELPHLVELPGRGLGSDMIGRAAALLVDIPLDVSTTGYRITVRRGSLAKRASDLLAQDLDALEEAWETVGLTGDGVLKVQSVGPLTLAAQIEFSTGRRILTDRGAVRDFAESLGEGLSRHAAEVTRRTGAQVIVQFDEPSLPAVLAGTLTGRTRLETVPAVPEPEALATLNSTIELSGRPVVVHCCGNDLPANLLRRSRAFGVGFDVSGLDSSALDGIGELIDAGKQLALGLVPTEDPAVTPGWRELAQPAVTLVDRLGFARTTLRTQMAVTPACGLAAASDAWSREAIRLTREVGSALTEDPESL